MARLIACVSKINMGDFIWEKSHRKFDVCEFTFTVVSLDGKFMAVAGIAPEGRYRERGSAFVYKIKKQIW